MELSFIRPPGDDVMQQLMEKVAFKSLKTYRNGLSEPIYNGGRIISSNGEMSQISNGIPFVFLLYIEFLMHPNKIRGNHYHQKKDEFMYIIKGRLRAVYEDIDTNERQSMILEEGALVNVKPRCAHIYIPLEYTQAIEFSPNEYD